MKIRKLDARMTGHGYFTYSVEFSYRVDRQTFNEFRTWCEEQWGKSCELDIWHFVPDHNPAWAWERNQGEKRSVCRIFLAGDPEVMWAKLRWA